MNRCDGATGNCVSDPKVCEDDGNPCTRDLCDPQTGDCIHQAKADGTPCADDGNECTNDVCQNGTCVHPAKADGAPCPDDGDPCTDDVCENGECEHSHEPDRDGDDVRDDCDNCPDDYNPDQADTDGDGKGDVCDCDLTVDVLAARFATGRLERWPDGLVLCPPPGGWHWTTTEGAIAPVVSGFDDHCSVLAMVRVLSATVGCGSAVEVAAVVGGVRIAVGSLGLAGGGYPVDVQVYLDSDGADPLPGSDAVGTLPGVVAFEWCANASGSGGQQCQNFGQAAATKWYVMPNRHPALPAGEERYDFGLDKVVAYASGQSSASAVAGAANSGIAVEVWYNPGCDHLDPQTDHPLIVYAHGEAVCMFNAMLLAYLAHAAGINGSPRYLWGGALTDRVDFYQYALPGNWVSFRAVAQQYEGAPENPHFKYHAQATIAGAWYDPSYGTVGLVSFSEVCPPYSELDGEAHYPPVPGETLRTPVQQQGDRWPPTGSPWYMLVPYTCPH